MTHKAHRDGKQHLWLTVEGRTPYFGKDGEVFSRRVDGPTPYVYGVREDGTGLRRLCDQPIQGLHGISHDGRWVIGKVHKKGGDTFMAEPVKEAPPFHPIPAEVASWSPEGRLIFISAPAAPTVSIQIGQAYVVPLPSGRMFPAIPAGGFQSAADLARLPGARVIEGYNVAPGPAPGMYAFSRETALRNLYRIPIP